MNAAERHRRIQELFDRICDLDPEARAAVLEEVEDRKLAAEVRALVDAEADAVALEVPAAVHLGELPPSPSRDRAPLPETVGDYDIVGLLGEGGMGIVYEAEERSPRRRVALKLVKEGFVTAEHLRRFKREAEALALIEHPGVARIYAAGTVHLEGAERPYIAMELVRGLPIGEHADAHGLDYHERLGLVVQLLKAVHHAHGRGVVHRDLKPANVLVTEEGEVKVLDFGIARIADPESTLMTGVTEVGQILGTLAYMSPEQLDSGGRDRASGPPSVDMRADVYAAGVIAYQLLSGQLPFDLRRRSLAEAARIIAEEEPTGLGRLDTNLRGDVNWIVHKALSKERDERYGSAEEFRRDIERFLGDQPVLARPPSSLDQLTKFARRNRGLVAGLGAAFLALVAGLIAVLLLLSKTSALLEDRDEEVAAADEAITFLEGLFAQTDPLADGDLSLSDMAARAAKGFENQLQGRPVQRARLLNSIGKTMIDLGMTAQAEPLLEEALKIHGETLGENTAEYAQTLERVAGIHMMHGRHRVAAEMQRRVLEIRRRELQDSPLVADALSNLAMSEGFLGNREASFALWQEAYDLLVRLFGERDRRTITLRLRMASGLAHAGRAKEALELFDELLAIEEHAAPHTSIEMRVQKAWALRFQRRLQESLATLDEARALLLDRYGDEVGLMRQIESGRAMALSGLGRTKEAVAVLRESLERTERRDGVNAMTVASMTHDLAYVVHDLPAPENAEAEALYRKAMERFTSQADASGGFVHMARHNLAMFLESAGRLEEALEEMTLAYEGRRQLLGADDQNTLASLRGLAGVLATMKRHGEAANRYREFVELGSRVMGSSLFPVQTARVQLAAEEARSGRPEVARELLNEAQKLASDMHDPEAFSERVRQARETLGL